MSAHIVPVRVYVAVFVALLVLTATTVGVAFVDLGPFNTIAALAIACLKAVLVILFFMHVRYSDHLTWVVVVGGFLWLAILLALTMGDFLSRDWIGVSLPGI